MKGGLSDDSWGLLQMGSGMSAGILTFTKYHERFAFHFCVLWLLGLRKWQYGIWNLFRPVVQRVK